VTCGAGGGAARVGARPAELGLMSAPAGVRGAALLVTPVLAGGVLGKLGLPAVATLGLAAGFAFATGAGFALVAALSTCGLAAAIREAAGFDAAFGDALGFTALERAGLRGAASVASPFVFAVRDFDDAASFRFGAAPPAFEPGVLSFAAALAPFDGAAAFAGALFFFVAAAPFVAPEPAGAADFPLPADGDFDFASPALRDPFFD